MKVLLALLLTAPAATHVRVSATFIPARAGSEAAVAVHLTPADPQVRVNEDPPPRLKLDKDQTVLIDRQPAASKRRGSLDPGQARYLDPAVPVAFAVSIDPRAAKGLHTVKGSVTYFYCSKREGWCRKGTAEVELPVRVP